MLKTFSHFRPETVEEALNLLKTHGSELKIIAGGTDVLVEMRNQLTGPDYLLSLKQIKDLNYITTSAESTQIGAATTLRELEKDTAIAEHYSALYDGISQIGSVQIRNVATLGGNLCSALPSADSASPLLVLDASLKLLSAAGEKSIPLQELYAGAGANTLGAAELLSEITIPLPPQKSASAYVKLGRRNAMEIAILGAAIFILFGDNDQCVDARVALSTAAPTPIRSPKAEAALKGKIINEESLLQAGEQAVLDASPRTSWRSTAEYRRDTIPFLVKRAGLLALDRYKSRTS